MRYAALIVGAYLLGSIPTGFIVARARGVDIRTVGSGNIGATNVFRILGKPAGIFVLLVDFLKGLAACWLLPLALFPEGSQDAGAMTAVVPSMVAGFCAILGHNYTCWLHFKGGKGIATSAGVLSALVPWALLIIFTVWVLSFALTRYVSLGSLAASVTLPFATWFIYRNWILTVVTAAMSTLAIYKHRANIQRLLNGTESRMSFKRRDLNEEPRERTS